MAEGLLSQTALKESAIRDVEEVLNGALQGLTETISTFDAKLDRKFSVMLEAIRLLTSGGVGAASSSDRNTPLPSQIVQPPPTGLLLEPFGEVIDDPIAELQNLRETEGILAYHCKFEKIRNRVQLPEPYLVSVYLAGLRNDTQMHVRMFQPQTIRQCLSLSKLYEAAESTRSGSMFQKPASATTVGVPKVASDLQLTRQLLTSEEMTDRQAQMDESLLEEKSEHQLCAINLGSTNTDNFVAEKCLSEILDDSVAIEDVIGAEAGRSVLDEYLLRRGSPIRAAEPSAKLQVYVKPPPSDERLLIVTTTQQQFEGRQYAGLEETVPIMYEAEAATEAFAKRLVVTTTPISLKFLSSLLSSFCLQDVRQNAYETLSSFLPPAKPPDDFMNPVKGLQCKILLSLGVKDDKSNSRCYLENFIADWLGLLIHRDWTFEGSVSWCLKHKCKLCFVRIIGYLPHISMDLKDHVSWNTMLSGLAQKGMYSDVLSFLQDMVNIGFKPDQFSVLSVTMAAGQLGKLLYGNQDHTYALKHGYCSDVHVGKNIYAKCSSAVYMNRICDAMDVKNLVTRTTFITGYVQNRSNLKAIESFTTAHTGVTDIDPLMISSVLVACKELKLVSYVKQVHAHITRHEVFDLMLQNTILDAYGAFGHIEYAARAFTLMESKDLVTWTSLITCYANNGLAKEAIELFASRKHSGLDPDFIVLVGLLSAVSSFSALRKESSHRLFENSRKNDLILWTCMINAYGVHGHTSMYYLLSICGKGSKFMRAECVFFEVQRRLARKKQCILMSFRHSHLYNDAKLPIEFWQNGALTHSDNGTILLLVQLKKHVGTTLTSNVLPSDLPELFIKEPEKVVERRLVNRNGKAATQVLIKWAHRSIEEATWEFLYDLL